MSLDINNYYDPKNPYSKLWKNITIKNLPERLNKVITMEWEDFYQKYHVNCNNNYKTLFSSLQNGDVYILKNTFSNSFLSKLKRYVIDNKFLKQKSEFHKILDNVPNFCRFIDEDLSKNYSFKQVKMTAYFFPFNDQSESLKVYDYIYPKWRTLKFISGYYEKVWENTIPSDGIVDRLQVVRYPPKSGYLELHQDPYLYQKFFISSYLTKKGEDYVNGGMYAIDKRNNKIDLEQLIDIGDLCFGIATIYHGVDICDKPEGSKDSFESGRWFLGLYTTESNYQENRHTGKPASIK